MSKTRLFISYDYDNDNDLTNLLVGQARNPDSPFEIADWSIKEASPGWRAEALRRIRASDVVAVICGQNTHRAHGVAVELSIAQEQRIPYFLLAGRANVSCQKPTTARSTDRLYTWTWPNLKALVGGSR